MMATKMVSYFKSESILVRRSQVVVIDQPPEMISSTRVWVKLFMAFEQEITP